MASSALTPIFSFLGWTFVPGWATSFLQSFYYRLTIPVGQTTPQPGTPRFAKDYRRIRILVLSLYLIYTLLQSLYDVRLAGDFYTLLSVTPSTSDREIRSRFRRLAAKYHPDKIHSATINPEDITTSSDTHFVLLKAAQETLLNPTLRFAYMRFGPSILRVTLPPTIKPSIGTYVYAGLKNNLLPQYIVNIATLTALNYFFLPKWGMYWRYYGLTLIFAVELYFLTHSDPSFTNLLPPFAQNFVSTPLHRVYYVLQKHTRLKDLLPPHLLPYQTLTVLRNLSISLNIFISQLAPPNHAAVGNTPARTQISGLLQNINQSLTHLVATAKRTDQETTALLSLQLTPFRNDPELISRLREGMEEGAVRGALMAHEEVRTAVRNVQAQRGHRNVTAGSHRPDNEGP